MNKAECLSQHFVCICLSLHFHWSFSPSRSSFLLFITSTLSFSPLRGCQEPESCCTSRSAGRVDASPYPVMSPSQLLWHTYTHLWDTMATTLQVHTFSLILLPRSGELLTEVHLLVAAGTQVGLSGKSGDAASCWHITDTLQCWKLEKLKRYGKGNGSMSNQ